MKKTTIKLASAFLMLSLMSTCLHAAELLDQNQQDAAIKIQGFVHKYSKVYADNKLKELFENIDTQIQTISQKTQENPDTIQVEFNAQIDSLNENSTIPDVLTAASWCFAVGELAPETGGKYMTYLETWRTCENPIKRQIASLIKSTTIQNIDELKEVLQELEISKYPFFQSSYYGTISRAFSAAKDIDQAEKNLRMKLKLPESYHAKAYRDLADLDRSEGYAPKRKSYLEEIIKIGNPEQVAKATFNVAGLYSPQEALSTYTSLLTNPTLLPYLDSNAIQLQIATLFAYDSTIHDEARATEMYKIIRLNRESIKNPDTYWNAGHHLVNIYMNQNEYSLALDLATETLKDPSFPEWRHEHLGNQLKTIHENGSDEIREIIDSSESLRNLIESKDEANDGEEADYDSDDN